jgi:hypothetical protein
MSTYIGRLQNCLIVKFGSTVCHRRYCGGFKLVCLFSSLIQMLLNDLLQY